MNEDKLPPLSQNSHGRLKREIQRLSPRIQGIEKDINFLRINIPNNFSKSIEELRFEIDEVLGKNIDQKNPINFQKNLEEFENEIMDKCTQSVQISSYELEKKISQMRPVTKVNTEIQPTKSENFLNLKQTAVTQRISALENVFKKQQNDINSQILQIQNKFSKLPKVKNISDFSEELHQISSTLNLSRAEINELQSQTDELQFRVQNLQIAQQPSQINRSISGSISSGDLEFDEGPCIPDLSPQLTQLQNELIEFQNEFTIQLAQAKSEQDSCDEKVKMIKGIGEDLLISTTSFESRVIESDNLCQSLLEQVSDLAKKIGDDKNTRMVQNLTLQIQSAHKNMKNDIDGLKERMKKIESYQPLI